MANPSPNPNLLGTGSPNKANLTSFKPGERRVGRVRGTPNKLPEFMEKIFQAASRIGYPQYRAAVDEFGHAEVGPDGKLTGRMEWVSTGEGGFDGYLEWLGLANTTGFVALIKSMIPHQVNLRTEKAEPENYRTVEDIAAELRAGGYSDEKIAFLLSDLRPKNPVIDIEGGAVNGGPKAEQPAAAPKQGDVGDYIDEDGVLRKG